MVLRDGKCSKLFEIVNFASGGGGNAIPKQEDNDAAPKVVVKKIEGKKETLERHVPQMLLRGEQVAIIVKIN